MLFCSCAIILSRSSIIKSFPFFTLQNYNNYEPNANFLTFFLNFSVLAQKKAVTFVNPPWLF